MARVRVGIGRWRYVRLAGLVLKLPTYARVVWGLMRDPRVPIPLKALMVAALAYLVSPLDLIPDVIPVLGQADDLTVLLLVLDIFIRNAPADVREDHMRRAREGTADLDRDLGKLRELMGDRYETIRDNLPRLLERHGELRDPRALQLALARWRDRRLGQSPPRSNRPAARSEAPERTREAIT